MDELGKLLPGVIAALPALLAPLMGWLLPQRGLARRTKEIENLQKRVELIEKLVALEKESTHRQGAYKDLLEAEFADVVEEVVALRQSERAAGRVHFESLPRRRRFLLLYDQPTLRASVYRGIFYVLWLFGLLGGASSLATAGFDEDWPFLLLGVGFYLVMGLLFRAAAVRQQKRATKTPVSSGEG